MMNNIIKKDEKQQLWIGENKVRQTIKISNVECKSGVSECSVLKNLNNKDFLVIYSGNWENT